jgi:hypothetical protein
LVARAPSDKRLLGKQVRILVAAIFGGALEFFDYWPSHLRTSGIGSANGLAGSTRSSARWASLIVGSGNYLKPDGPLPQIPLAILYLGCWFLIAGLVYYFFGVETGGKLIEQQRRPNSRSLARANKNE